MRKKHPQITPGDKFNSASGCSAVVLAYNNKDSVIIQFLDEHEYKTEVSAHHLRTGSIRNRFRPSVAGVGFHGDGPHDSRSGRKRTKEYKTWKDMLNRCYSRTLHERSPAYADCSVATEWHNFQAFAEWCKSQPENGLDSYELDKDILKPGNKVYCPEYCMLVPKRINLLMIRYSAKKTTPLGLSSCRKTGKYRVRCRRDGVYVELGFYDCQDEAFAVYKSYKEGVIREVASEMRSHISERLYSALMRYEVQP